MTDTTPADRPLTGRTRILIGLLGAVVAAAAKFVGQDHGRIFTNDGVNYSNLEAALIGYPLLFIALALVGCIVAWTSKENNRRNLLFIAVSAPAMVTTLSGGGNVMAPHAAPAPAGVHAAQATWTWPSLIAPARAQTETAAKPKAMGPPAERSAIQKLEDGLRFVFRVGEPRYWVVVGSEPDRTQAAALVDEINAADPSLGAFVGIRSANGQYPVIVGRYAPYSDARAMLEQAKQLDFLAKRGPFLSPG